MSSSQSRLRKTKLPNYEQPYEALFEQVNDAVVILDPEGRYVAFNARTTEMLGYTEEELLGMPMSETVKPEEYPQSERVMERLLAGQRVPIYERTLIRKDGETVSVEINASLVRDEQGRPAYFQAVRRDISDRKREEEALRRIAEVTAGGPDTAFFQAAVKHLARTLRMHAACITEWSVDDPGRARVMAWWIGGERHDATEYAIAGTPSETVFEGQEVFHRSGIREVYPNDPLMTEIVADSYLGIPLRDPAGEVVGHLALFDHRPAPEALRQRPVLRIFASRIGSELARRRAERKREASEVRYRALVEQLPAVTYAVAMEEDTPALYVSPQVKRVLGFSVAEFCVQPSRWRRQLHPDDRERVLNSLGRTLKTRRAFRMEYRIYRKDTTLAWVRDEAIVIEPGDGGAPFLQGIMLDVTVEKRLTEELLNTRKLESVGMLAGGIAHDFNNSLMGILGNLSIAKSRIGEQHKAYHRLFEAEKAALRAKGLTQQLLTFSKGGAPVRRSTSIEGVIRDTVEFTLSGSNAEGRVEIEPHLWPADVDTGQISQVLENLVLNAVQATPGGGLVEVFADNVEIDGESELPLSPGRYVRLRVRDEGVGIPNEIIDRIFDPYFTTKETGTGLGLATSYAVVQKHEGHLGARSRDRSGSEFTLHLPAGAHAETRPSEAPPSTSERRVRVLVMDDDELVIETVSAMLEEFGHSGEFVGDGASAVRAYRRAMEEERPFHAIILDLTIRGGFGGEEAMRRILELDSNAVGIVSSGYSESTVMADSTRYGFRGCIAKPYRPDELRTILDRVLGQVR